MNLRWSLFALIVGLVAIGQGTDYWTSTRRLEDAIREREIAKVSSLAVNADALFTGFSNRATITASLLSRDPRIGSALAGSRPLKLAEIVDDAFRASPLSRLEVVDGEEIVRYRADAPQRSGDRTGAWGVYEALNGKSTLTVEALEGALVFRALEPLRVDGRIVGVIVAGVQFDQREIDRLSAQTGTQLMLLSPLNRILWSGTSATRQAIETDDSAVARAFHEKIPIFRHDPRSRVTSAYVPVLIVDEAFVLQMQIDSASAYAVIEQYTLQAAQATLFLLVGSLALALAMLKFVLAPVRDLGKRSRKIALEILGESMQVDAGDELASTVRTLDTLTERLLMRNREIEQSRLEAHKASAAKSEFLASMSHEIRTPLNGVLGMADLLQRTQLDEGQRRYCDAIASSGRALRDLLGDILDLSKIEAGKVELEREDFDLARLFEDLGTGFRELSGARGNSLHAAVHLPVQARYCGDALRLRQVLSNLLSNAIKFTENGRIDLGARLLEARPGDTRQWLRFTVKDTGVGMNEETLATLFQPFVQGDSSTTREYGGTGLGLAISKQLVELMGGMIELQSSPGVGTEFRVELPFEPAHEVAAAKALAPPAPAAPAGASLAVLLVEDNDINQEVARAMLEGAGHRVELANEGTEAVRKCAQGRYDLVLMDCQMPVMDGFEATRRIRAGEAERGAARQSIVALTANAMSGDRERCIAAGMDDFLSKPFDTASLLAAVARNTARAATPAAPTVAATAAPVSLDPAGLEALAKLDREAPGILAKLTGLFLNGTPAFIASIASASEASKDEAQRAAHTLKSTSARFGAKALAELAAQAETAARAGQLDIVRKLGEAMRAEFAQVAELMQQHPVLARKTGQV